MTEKQAFEVTGVDRLGNTIIRRRVVEDINRAESENPNGTVNSSASNGQASAAVAIKKAAYKGKYRHVAAIHEEAKPSCLSHDATDTPSFLGFRNLMVIVLVASNLRLIIENIQKYGVLICVRCHDFRASDVKLGLGLYFLIPLHLLLAYFIELVAASHARSTRAKIEKEKRDGSSSPTALQSKRFQRTWTVIWLLHSLNATVALVFTSWVVYNYIHHPLIGTLTETHAIITWLKTASYAFTNRDLRHAYLHPAKGELDALPELYRQCPYPKNVTIKNLVYFWWAPTLVYQPVYPRSEKIRWVFLFKRLGEVVVLSAFIWFLSAQYATPVLVNSLDKIASLDYFSILERLLKLSTISLVIWLAGFFALFQSGLNALAEITRFGDRSFYEPWWNSPGLGVYWRTWNKPVHHFFLRHVYQPMRGRGWSHKAASLVVFFLSALLHELLVGIPTHNLIGIAFLGMFLQIPLVQITAPLERMKSPSGKLLGNTIFWVSFTILGQPLAVLLYFYAWQAKYGSVSRSMTTMQRPPVCPPCPSSCT
ncbi:O-acyltransferase-like protein [Thermochaetoides thermophila DSM 1495]|uniref:O-acyltransferase n=1 Tax=Chaetomium thermophilum (strain DSM 1495 / CBS 144.50 / IMI 039719) TaxID=759272 RepID=G0SHB7_CHATD|nr:O-acyltransferase-like protein [Thermochaetoides thermophila DSM 1495]EGS17606.1 O-acyltransferase-like protein [Thermochaetoides thermophila DSM 1495]